jgi:hypothetical protein
MVESIDESKSSMTVNPEVLNSTSTTFNQFLTESIEENPSHSLIIEVQFLILLNSYK